MSFNVGIIAEGPTDVAVIENVVAGITSSTDNSYTYLKPVSVIGAYSPSDISNWSQVLSYCESAEFRDLVVSGDYVDFVVIHIDTDQFDHVNFNIPTHENGVRIRPIRRYEIAQEIIVGRIGRDLFDAVQDKIVFAICVDTIECWLLPIYFASAVAKRSKVTGCFETLRSHDVARRLEKTYAAYKRLSAPYAKQRFILTHAEHNFSLGEFVANVHVALEQLLP